MESFKFKFYMSPNGVTFEVSGGNENCTTVLPPPPPPPPSSFIHYNSSPSSYSHRSVLSDALVAMVALVATAFLLVSFYVTLLRCCQRRNTTRRTLQQQNPPSTDGFFLNQDTINHIWYINTVGLEESLINSIGVVKFKGGEGLVEGTDCSVCLSEFQEGDDLRLLPKCSHAFHLQCIDRWLRAHVNCPLCRAPIMADSVTSVNSLPVEGNSTLFLGTGESIAVSESNVDDQGGNLESSVVEVGEVDVEYGKGNRELDAPYVISGESSRGQQNERMVEESSADFSVRRSVSMNFLVRDHVSEGLEANPGREFFCVPSGSVVSTGSSYPEKLNLEELPRFKGVDIESGDNCCEVKVVGDADKGLSVNRSRSDMKRSFTISGSFFFSKHRRHQSLVLPL